MKYSQSSPNVDKTLYNESALNAIIFQMHSMTVVSCEIISPLYDVVARACSLIVNSTEI